MLNALRLVEGFESRLFTERTGLPLTLIENELSNAESRGLLERDWQRIRPTARGQRFLNELLESFLTAGRRSPAPASG
jgi:coproporphyrinogen III oxidase-like Fe-S oxidoreductase